jgi:hypothetical protein
MLEYRPALVGTADPSGAATPIIANVVELGSMLPVAVRLLVDYAMASPPGYPFRPSFTGSDAAQSPRTIATGTTLKLLACEATALVNAGAATYA